MYIFGYYFDRTDPTLYLVAWVIVTLFLVVLATKWGATAVGFALTALFGLIIYTQRNNPTALPSSPGASGQSGFGQGGKAGGGSGGGGGGSW